MKKIKTKVEHRGNFILHLIQDLFNKRLTWSTLKHRFDLMKKYRFYVYISDGTIIAAQLRDGEYAFYDHSYVQELIKK